MHISGLFVTFSLCVIKAIQISVQSHCSLAIKRSIGPSTLTVRNLLFFLACPARPVAE
jgi:hypothetical protein